MHEYWAYLDIHDEPFSVYPVDRMKNERGLIFDIKHLQFLMVREFAQLYF